MRKYLPNETVTWLSTKSDITSNAPSISGAMVTIAAFSREPYMSVTTVTPLHLGVVINDGLWAPFLSGLIKGPSTWAPRKKLLLYGVKIMQ